MGTDQYVSPDPETATTTRGNPAELWEADRRDCDEPLPKQQRVEATEASITAVEDVPLCPAQREVLSRLVPTLADDSSIVITNPLRPDNPIVFVTEPWERMCGFTSKQAVGRNPRLTQGEMSDQGSIRQISGALQHQRSCKVMMLNYRSGLHDRPFWNMLAISPIMHRGELMFYLANLRDYTYHMAKIMTLTPAQFCRSAEYHQAPRRLPSGKEKLSLLARPSVIETDDEFTLNVAPSSSAEGSQGGTSTMLQMKRLGWSKLSLDPEHLTDRVLDSLATMDARYELVDGTSDKDELFVVNADIRGVACRVLVTRDPACEGAYRISCSRLGGDTFAYHEAFRELRRLLGDALDGSESLTSGARPAAGAFAKRGAGGGGIPMARGGMARGGGGMMLAPLPELPEPQVPTAEAPTGACQ